MADEKTTRPGLTTPAGRHDALFRAILESPDRATALIRDYLPAEIRAHLAETPPRLVDGSFIDEALRGSQSDRLFEVDLKTGGTAFIFTLVEHKAYPDPRTPLQLLGYQLRIWQRYAGTSASRLRALPPIVPLLFFHGRERWTVPRSIFGMIDAPDDLTPFIRSLGYVLTDLGEIDTEALSDHAGLWAGLATLKHAFETRVPQALLRDILSALPDEDGPFEIAVLVYIVGAYQLDPETLEAALREAKPDRWEAMMGTIGEIWSKEAHEKGMLVGREEGMLAGREEGMLAGREEGMLTGEARGVAKGKAEGKAEDLTRLLTRRFGPLPDPIAARIADAELDQLDSWLDRLLDAPTLEAVFAADTSH